MKISRKNHLEIAFSIMYILKLLMIPNVIFRLFCSDIRFSSVLDNIYSMESFVSKVFKLS